MSASKHRLVAALCAALSLGVLVVLVAAAVPAGAGLALSTSATAGPSTYDDPAGDGNGAPDVTRVLVSNDDAGTITMRLAVPDRQQLGQDDFVGLWIDADRNDATGQYGDEYRLLRFTFGTYFERWNGSDWDLYAAPSLVIRWNPGELMLSAKRDDLGIEDAFDFDVESIVFAGEDPAAWPYDDAPDFGSWTYTMVFAPTLGRAKAQPARPKAGRLFSVAVPVLAGGKPVDSGTVKCIATVGGKRLAAASGLNAGTAGCAWRIPANAAGKSFRGSMSVTTGGGTAKRSFSATVR
jgi:hypothetical protein